MSTDDARGVERPAALTALRRFAEAHAVTARSLGQGQTERGWLDALALLDQADKQVARLIEQREAAARAEGRREVREAVEAVIASHGGPVYNLSGDDYGAGYVQGCSWTDESWTDDLRAVLAGQGGESGEGA